MAWEQERAKRRLVEASQLAAEGKLDDDAREQVSKLFAEHTEAVVEQVLAYEATDRITSYNVCYTKLLRIQISNL